MAQRNATVCVRRQVVLPNSLWVLLGLGIATWCTGSRVEAQQKDEENTPEPPTFEKAAKDFYHDFRNSPFPTKGLRFAPRNAAKVIKAEPEGLRITLSDKDETAGVATQFNVKGDFEITVGYEILQVEGPTRSTGAGIELYLMTETPTKEALAFARRVRPNGRAVYTYSHMTTNSQGKREADISEEKPATGQYGQLRITRIGPKAVMSITEGDSKNFQVLYRINLGNEDVNLLRLAANPGGSAHVVDLRLRDVRIRSEARAEFVDTSPPPRGTALWLVAGLIAAVTIICGILWWSRRRRKRDGFGDRGAASQ